MKKEVWLQTVRNKANVSIEHTFGQACWASEHGHAANILTTNKQGGGGGGGGGVLMAAGVTCDSEKGAAGPVYQK